MYIILIVLGCIITAFSIIGEVMTRRHPLTRLACTTGGISGLSMILVGFAMRTLGVGV